MISVNDIWEISCNYFDCCFCNCGMCYGGTSQCPHIKERAAACIDLAVKDLEEFKAQTPYGEEYYADLAEFEKKVRIYRILVDGY